jgi:hypothetical protein
MRIGYVPGGSLRGRLMELGHPLAAFAEATGARLFGPCLSPSRASSGRATVAWRPAQFEAYSGSVI